MSLSYTECTLCPRKCGCDRTLTRGYCGETGSVRIARAALHFWEEPCVSGKRGSGTVFFTGCSLRCVFCQNNTISQGFSGRDISVGRLTDIFFELKEKGAHNINLVTASHFTPSVIEAIEEAKLRKLNLPFVWNSGGYENTETLKALDGLIDIYMPDFKYMSPILASKYSKAADYPDIAKTAVREMFRQRGKPVYGRSGMLKSGVIVRHLVLPTHSFDSEKVLSYLYSEYGDDIIISIMNQYTPLPGIPFPELSSHLERSEYEKTVRFARELGIKNAYIQQGGTAAESFIPDFFGYEGV